MSAFDKVIGYESIKNELLQICDMIQNRDVYEEFGARLPQGVLLHGDPGLGKTLMAKCFIEESGLPAYVVRRNMSSDDFIGNITETFQKARENAPCIVFLDDMDKFANDDGNHQDSEEYVTVQACIDDAKGKEVFVLATVNDVSKLPKSLIRAGRFDQRIDVKPPTADDAEKIVAYYLSQKRLGGDLEPNVIAALLTGHSCAVLETVINEAGLLAGYQRSDVVTMEHIVDACLRIVDDISGIPEDRPAVDLRSGRVDAFVCYHEAGHAVVREVLYPGSVSLVLARSDMGFTRGWSANEKDEFFWQADIIDSLAGRAAVELKYNRFDMGAEGDMECAFEMTRGLVKYQCYCGFDLYGGDERFLSDGLKAKQEAAIAAEVERYYRKAKELLSRNIAFLDAVAKGLAEKGLLTAADIRRIRENCTITPVTI